MGVTIEQVSGLMQAPQIIDAAAQRLEDTQATVLASGAAYAREELAVLLQQYLTTQADQMPAPAVLVRTRGDSCLECGAPCAIHS